MSDYNDHFKKFKNKKTNYKITKKNIHHQKKMDSEENIRKLLKIKNKKYSFVEHIPIKWIMPLLIGFIGATILYFNPEKIENFFGHYKIIPQSIAIAKSTAEKEKKQNQESSSKSKIKDQKKNSENSKINSKNEEENSSDLSGKEEINTSQVTENDGDEFKELKKWTPEELRFFTSLAERKKELDEKEAHLKKVEEDLQEEKKRINEKVENLEKIRRDIASTLEDKVTVDKAKIEKLVEFYSNMKPENAAKIIETLDTELAVGVIGSMKKKDAANILNLLKPEKAKILSEKFTGYR